MSNLNNQLSGFNPKVNNGLIQKKIKEYSSVKIKGERRLEAIKQVASMIDLTTLEGSDTGEKVSALCKKAIKPQRGFPHCAAVCVYPTMIKFAKKALKGSRVKLASVATGFPSGQYPLNIKLADVKYCIEQGAEEIDMVISRGEFLSGNFDYVYYEIKKVKAVCNSFKNKQIHLKVILETGELGDYKNIRKASFIAMLAGADFIKTSTGKIPVAATLSSVYVMCVAIRDFYKKTGKIVGMKAAGGIRTADEAFQYIAIVKDVLGSKWLSPDLFRFGASSLLNDLLKEYNLTYK